MGEGRARDADGVERPVPELLAAAGIRPVELAEKEIKTATVESQARAAYNSAMAVMQPGLTISRTVEKDRAGKASRTTITVVRGEHSLQYLIADGEAVVGVITTL